VRSYGAVAWCYDEVAALYSLGSIAAAKRSQLQELRPGDRVLYAGVGRGSDALEAARRGAQVTALDVSPAMLRRLRRRLAGAAQQAELLCADLFEHRPASCYDAVAANFVLNVFDPHEMRRALLHLVSLLRPGGKLLIADFAPPQGGRFERALARAYYRPVNLAAWSLGLCALHPIYDYARPLESIGLQVLRRRGFRPARAVPVLYESLVARRPGWLPADA